MTNKEQLDLIAQARELCEEQIREVIDEVKWHHTSTEDITAELNARKELNSWTTHLAEMDEHEGIHTFAGYVCKYCSPWRSFEGGQVEYPCNFLVTKAKLLLGVTTDA